MGLREEVSQCGPGTEPWWVLGTPTNAFSKRLYAAEHGSYKHNCSYEQLHVCDKLCISSLSARRYQLTSCFFHKILQSTSCLHHLIPPRRDNSQTAKLRKPTVYDIPFACTNKFKNSFILYALHNYLQLTSLPLITYHLSHHLSHMCVSYCIVFNVFASLYQFYASFYVHVLISSYVTV